MTENSQNSHIKANSVSKSPIGFYLLGPIIGLLALLLTGCANHTLRFYPIGIYGVPTTNELATVRKAGFNVVAGPPQKDYLDAARKLGMKVMASPGTAAGTGFNSAIARSKVSALDSHPALWAWYLVDEPDLHRVDPVLVENANRFLKNLPARKPTILVIYQGYTALDYANITDILMIDRYPIPWLPLANVAQHVQMTRLAIGKKKPLIAVIQAFDWSAYPQQLPGEKNLRAPSYEELRGMVYSALSKRANGLFFYAFEGGDWKIRDHPQVWEDTQQVVKEVRKRLPLFEAEHLWWPHHARFQDPSIRFNEALESSIAVSLLRVKQGNETIPAGDYILGVNTTDKHHVYSFTVPHIKIGVAEVLGENRLIPILHNWIKDEFDPYAVHVYGPLPGSFEPSSN